MMKTNFSNHKCTGTSYFHIYALFLLFFMSEDKLSSHKSKKEFLSLISHWKYWKKRPQTFMPNPAAHEHTDAASEGRGYFLFHSDKEKNTCETASR